MSDVPSTPSLRGLAWPRALLRALVAHNPFYLLSALLMLAGCYTLSRTLALKPGSMGKLLVLLGTLNGYELLVILLALLLARRGLERDPRVLLLVESFFLLDGTFLSGEAFAADRWVGSLVSAVILGLAFGKLAVVASTLRFSRDSGLRFLIAELALLFALPGIFSFAASAGLVSQTALVFPYFMWWIAAGLIVAQAALARQTQAPATPRGAIESSLRAGLAFMPHVFLALHLIGVGWVHHVSFQVAYLAPLIVGATAARMLVEFGGLGLDWRVPVVAMFLSLFADDGMLPGSLMGIRLVPLHVVVAASGAAYLLGYRLHRLRSFAWGAALCLGGPVLLLSARAFQAVFSAIGEWMPRTGEHWGVLAVVLAFLLLAAGAAVSLLGSRGGPPSTGGATGE